MLVSIISCCKDDYENLCATLSSFSLLADLQASVEVLVWDVSSEPEDIAVLVADSGAVANIKQIYAKDRGLYDGLNKAIQVASGEYVVIINAGDQILPPIRDIFSRIKHDDESAFEKNISIYAAPVMTWRNRIVAPRQDFSVFIHQGLIYRKSLHTKYGPYLVAPNFTASDFLFFYGQVDATSESIIYSNEPIAYYAKPGLSSSALHFIQRDCVVGAVTKRSVFWFFGRMFLTSLRYCAGYIRRTIS